jgi:NADH:ubiquinone oxidoreductase subunit 6 (subunit J)
VLAGLLALLAAVAIASTGDIPLGSGGARRPADYVLDVLVSLVLVVMAAGLVALGVLLFLGRDLFAERSRRRHEQRGSGIVAAAAAFVVLAAVVWWMSNRQAEPGAQDQGAGASRPAGVDADEASNDYRPQFALIPVLVLGGLVVTAGTAAYLSHRARRRHLGVGGPELLLADVLEETLDDVRAESDPATAVIAAYARLERALSAYGLPRRPAEAPQEYVVRVLGELEVALSPVERLTALFVQAKFSTHAISPEAKEEAIAALEEVRETLRAEEQRAAEERLAAIAEARERAATQ